MTAKTNKPIKYLAENVSYSKVKPTKEVFNYYVYMYGWDEALRVFDLTPIQAEKILFPELPKASDFKRLKGGSDYTIQGNRDPIVAEGIVVHDTVEYRSVGV